MGRVHPRDGAGVPQAHDRADRDRHEADLGGARRRRAVLPRAHHGDLGRRAARRRGHGQRDRLPGGRARGRAVGALRLGEPARDARREAPAGPLGLAGGRPERVAGLRRRVPPPARGAARVPQRLPRVGGHRAVPARRVQHLFEVAEPLPVPRGGRLRPRAAARRHLAPAAIDGAHERRAVRRAGAPARRRQGRVPLARVARVHGRGPDAAADRRPRDDRASRDRLDGAAEGPDDAGAEHVRRPVPAAAVDPAAVRSADHARREQHGVRGLPLRPADDRAAAVLGSVRQRAAPRRDGVRGPAPDLRLDR